MMIAIVMDERGQNWPKGMSVPTGAERDPVDFCGIF